MKDKDLAASIRARPDADVVELYGRVVEMRLSGKVLRGAMAAADSRLEDDIKREAAAEKEADAAERRLAEQTKKVEEEIHLLETSDNERRVRQERELERRRADLEITESEAEDALARFREQVLLDKELERAKEGRRKDREAEERELAEEERKASEMEKAAEGLEAAAAAAEKFLAQAEKTRKSVEASCREMEEAATQADKALAALERKSRELDDAKVAKKVAENVEQLRDTELGLAELTERKAGLEQRSTVRRGRVEDIAGRTTFREEMCDALRTALGARKMLSLAAEYEAVAAEERKMAAAAIRVDAETQTAMIEAQLSTVQRSTSRCNYPFF